MKDRKHMIHSRLRQTPVSSAFQENSSLLKRFLSRFFADHQDVEDVAQEAFLRAYVAEQSKEIDQPKAYLFRIAKNVAMTKLTKKSRQISHLINLSSEAMDSPEFSASAGEEVEAMEILGSYCEAVAALPEKCREVFLLRKVHGLSHQEIADRMSLSISSVEKYLSKGVLDCRDYLNRKENSVDVKQRKHSDARRDNSRGGSRR